MTSSATDLARQSPGLTTSRVFCRENLPLFHLAQNLFCKSLVHLPYVGKIIYAHPSETANHFTTMFTGSF